MTAPAGNLALNGHKITSVADATISSDLLNRQTADSRYYSSSAELQAITAPTGNLNLNGYKITSLAATTSNSELSTKEYIDDSIAMFDGTVSKIQNATNSDSKITANSTEMTNNLTPLNMNGYKVTSLADATAATDALNRQTADSRYYSNATTLDSITAPSASLSLDGHKITALADATTATDALNR